MSEFVAAAQSLAAGLLNIPALTHRWAHVQGVGQRARELSITVDLPDRELLVAAAWLHDIGYAPSLVTTGLHSLDGAQHLQQHGYPLRLACLVAHHTGARFEAAERGLTRQLDLFPLEEGPVMDALVTADLTIGPQGQRFNVNERIQEILHRYPPQSAVHRAIRHAKPVLLAHVQRTLDRLDKTTDTHRDATSA